MFQHSFLVIALHQCCISTTGGGVDMIVNVDVASKAYKIVKNRPYSNKVYVVDSKEEIVIKNMLNN